MPPEIAVLSLREEAEKLNEKRLRNWKVDQICQVLNSEFCGDDKFFDKEAFIKAVEESPKIDWNIR